MLIRLNVDQVRVIRLWGFGAGLTQGQADMGPGRHGAGLKQVLMPITQFRKFENKFKKMRIYTVPAIKLRGGLNSVDFFTSKIKFPDLKWVPFMPYTYNIEGQHDGTRQEQTTLTRKEFKII